MTRVVRSGRSPIRIAQFNRRPPDPVDRPARPLAEAVSAFPPPVPDPVPREQLPVPKWTAIPVRRHADNTVSWSARARLGAQHLISLTNWQSHLPPGG